MKKFKFDDIIKNKNLFIAVCVFGLTVISIGVSYASFFSVKTNTNNQVVTTGTLAVSYGSGTSAIQKNNNMSSMSDEMGMEQGDSSLIYIQNTGTLPSTFTLNVGYDMEGFVSRAGYKDTDFLTPLDYVMLAVYECDGAGRNDRLVVGPISIVDLPIYKLNSEDNRYNRYSLVFSSVGSTSSTNSTKTYKIKAWLSDKAIPAASYSYFYINTEVVAEVEHAKMSYDFTGILKDTSNNLLTGAVISLQNGSITSTANESGNYTLSGVYPGVYNVDISYNGKKYSGNLTVVEGTSKELISLGSSFSSDNIYKAAYDYGTSVGSIMKKNNLNNYSSSLNLSSGTTYNLMPTYKFTGASEASVNSLDIVIDVNNGTYTMSLNEIL